jgi:hypothetical protein
MIRYQGKTVDPIGSMRGTGCAARRLSGLVCMDERSEVGGKAWARSDVAQSHAKTEVVLVHIRREEVDQITRVKISERKTAASAGLEASFVLEEIILCYQRCLVFSHSGCPLA